MENVLNFIGLGWVGSILGIVGIALSIWFYFKSQQKADPVAVIESMRLVGGPHQSLPNQIEILYEGKPVPRVTKSVVRIWNAGNVTLDGKDVVPTEPIRLVTDENSEILSASILLRTRKVNGANVTLGQDKRNCATVSFDFLDPADGFVIELLHTSDEHNPNIEGVIKGISEGIKLRLRQPLKITTPTTKSSKRQSIAHLIVTWGYLLGGILLFVAALDIPWFDAIFWPTKPSRIPTTWDRVFMFMPPSMFVVLGTLMLRRNRVPYPKSLVNVEVAQN
jgi:hypothetical protein